MAIAFLSQLTYLTFNKNMSEFNLHGFDLFGEAIKPKNQGIVASRFTFPPFTILDAK